MIKIVISEDHDGVAESIGALLHAAHRTVLTPSGAIANPLQLHRVKCMKDLHEYDMNGMDVILLDLRYPDFKEEQTLAWLSTHAEHLPPVIVITALLSNDNPSAWKMPSMAAGADSFFHKSKLDERGGGYLLYEAIIDALARASRRKKYVNHAPV